MTKIRKINYLDKFRFKKKISFLEKNVVEHYMRSFKYFPFSHLHTYLPLCVKFLPESYVIENKGDILGLITLAPAHANPHKQTISRLFLDNEHFGVAKELVDFSVARYGAKGAKEFLAVVDSENAELMNLFSKECGFRQCSGKELWKLDVEASNIGLKYKIFRNSDAKKVVELYNDSLIPHFKSALTKVKEEYSDPPFKSLDEDYMLKYLVEDEKNRLIAFFTIITNDNKNFILSITPSMWDEIPYEEIVRAAKWEICKRNKQGTMYVKVRRYMQKIDVLENFLREKGGECTQNQVVFVKDFYREIKVDSPILLFNQIKSQV